MEQTIQLTWMDRIYENARLRIFLLPCTGSFALDTLNLSSSPLLTLTIIQGYVSILIMLALERTVVRRQDWRRHYRSEIKMNSQLTALYPSVQWKQADDSFLLCGKFLLNHWFYMFGVEVGYATWIFVLWGFLNLSWRTKFDAWYDHLVFEMTYVTWPQLALWKKTMEPRLLKKNVVYLYGVNIFRIFINGNNHHWYFYLWLYNLIYFFCRLVM